MKMKRALAPFAALACHLGFDAHLRRRTRGRLRILMYHGVVERALQPFCWHQLPRAAFRRQLQWIQKQFHVLPLLEALERLAAGTLPPNPCALTFDDGYRNNLTVAEPILRELGLPATVFLPTDHIGTEEPLWPDRVHLALAGTSAASVDLSAMGLGTRSLNSDAERAAAIYPALHAMKGLPRAEKDAQVEALIRSTAPADPADASAFALLDWDEVHAARGAGVFAFAPHSTTHEILSGCEDGVVREQIEGSCDAVAERLGARPLVFAYPNGQAIDFDDRAKAVLREAGVRWALTTERGLNGADTDPLALRRICVGADVPFAIFKLMVSGLRGSP